MPRSGALLLLLFLAGGRLASATEDAILREDWIASYEPTHPDYWGIQWGIHNVILPLRMVQRGKRELESRYADNFRFEGRHWALRVLGGGLRYLSTSQDQQLLLDRTNLHHVLGHDARFREIASDFAPEFPGAPRRMTSVLPDFLGGSDLDAHPTNEFSNTPDVNTLGNTSPMEAENELAYAAGKGILAPERVNAFSVLNFITFRSRFQKDEVQETGELTEAYALAASSVNFHQTDLMGFLKDLNKGRYGAARLGDFKLNMADIHRAFKIQLLDPIFWIAAFQYGKDFIVYGKNQTRMPMIPLPGGAGYLPGVRVYFSPFGIEYYQDNYFRVGGALINAYWTRGDNRWQKRAGFGLDVENISLPKGILLGLFLARHRQPYLDLRRFSALAPSEIGERHDVYKIGCSLRVPIWRFEQAVPDPIRAFLYTRVGYKNKGWLPGEYLAGRGFAQLGLGLRF